MKLLKEDIRYLVIHTAAAREASIGDITRWHVEERGWSDVGYHYYIRKDGEIQKGREDDQVGAHCKASRMNYKSLGICFEGHHDHEEWTREQEDAFEILCRVLQNKYGIHDDRIIGHREAYQGDPLTTCPGIKIDMDEVRRKFPKLGSDKVNPARLEEFESNIDQIK